MIEWQKKIFETMLGAAGQTALAREVVAKVENPFAAKTEKELARIMADAMASAAARGIPLGKAVIKLLGKKRK